MTSVITQLNANVQNDNQGINDFLLTEMPTSADDFKFDMGLENYQMKLQNHLNPIYPTMLSPPESPPQNVQNNLRNTQSQISHPSPTTTPFTPLNNSFAGQYSPLFNATQDANWLNNQPYMRQRSDSIAWMPQQQPHLSPIMHTHARSMSLPHVMQPLSNQDYPLLNMDFGLNSAQFGRKNSVTSNGSEKIFACTHGNCDKTFSRVQNLRSHMRCHLTTTPHNCKHCGLGFRRTTDLQRHVRTMHTPNDQKPWPCPKCPKRFGRSDALKRHMSSRSKDHGCPGGPDLALLAKMEESKRLKQQAKKLATVLEGLPQQF